MSFSIRLLRAIVGVDAVDAIDDAAAAALVRTEADSVSFSHALVRQALLDELSTARRVRIHRAIAEAIEAQPDAMNHVELLAHHFAEAAVDGRPEHAAHWARVAAERAMALGAYEHCERHVRRALDALAEAGVDDPALRAPLLVLLANVLPGVAGGTEAVHLATSHDVIEAALASGSLDLVLAAIDVSWPVADPDGPLVVSPGPTEYHTHLGRAVAVLQQHRGELDSAALAYLLGLEGMLALPDVDRSDAILREAAAMAPVGSRALARVLSTQGLRGTNRPDPAATLAIATRIEQLPPESLDLWARNTALGLRAVAAVQSCDRAAFTDVWRQTEERVQRTGGGWIFERTRNITRSTIAQLDADWDGLAAVADDVLAHATDLWGMNNWAAVQFMLHMETGRLATFEDAFEAAVARADHGASRSFELGLALLRAHTNRAEEARATLHELVQVVIADQVQVFGVLNLWIAAEIATVIEDESIATTLLPHLDPWTGILLVANQGTLVLALADQVRAELLRVIGRLDESEAAARAAVASAAQMESVWLLAHAQLSLARTLATRRDDEALEAARAAWETATAARMPLLAAASRRILATDPEAANPRWT
jgi:hypothetical protein